MDDNARSRKLELLHQRRAELRNRLASAWETRAPKDVIRKIEHDIRVVWKRIDEADADIERPHPKPKPPQPARRLKCA